MRHFILSFVLLSLLFFFLTAHAGPTDDVEKFLSAFLVSTSWRLVQLQSLNSPSVTGETRPNCVAYCEHSVDVSYGEASWHSRLFKSSSCYIACNARKSFLAKDLNDADPAFYLLMCLIIGFEPFRLFNFNNYKVKYKCGDAGRDSFHRTKNS